MTNFYHWNLIRICAILELVWNSPIVLQVQAYPCKCRLLVVFLWNQLEPRCQQRGPWSYSEAIAGTGRVAHGSPGPGATQEQAGSEDIPRHVRKMSGQYSLGPSPQANQSVPLTVASNHLQGPHRESPKAMSKLSDTLIDSHLGQRRYHSRKKRSYLINCTLSIAHEVVYPKKNTHLIIHTLTLYCTLSDGLEVKLCIWLCQSIWWPSSRCTNFTPHSARLQLRRERKIEINSDSWL